MALRENARARGPGGEASRHQKGCTLVGLSYS
jgi:hypothetical protein